MSIEQEGLEELRGQIEALRTTAEQRGIDMADQLAPLQKKLDAAEEAAMAGLSRFDRVKLARNQDRPFTLDFIDHLCEDFFELRGDRTFRDDPAIVGGWATFAGRSVMVVGHQKGREMKENLHRNFGSPHPEGYRKAKRLFRLAEKFGRPVITFVDTQGAYPGIGAEERGQAEAIAANLFVMAGLRVPIVTCVIGEGGSGGALGIAVADRVLMMENAIYSVISPEGCAAILWRSREKAELAAEALKLTASDLFELGVVDEVVPEPRGGAHSDPIGAMAAVGESLKRHLDELSRVDREDLVEQRREKYYRMGAWEEA
ncbi:MAG: acetyl-CoA carboxylase carboxyltransferase subunit alpha [Gemmatimonadota bacterium]|nr:acetyl-CoA carboxylase carboxyltransferase subunit alpha [Gemmatimonadota bacterium]